MHDALRLITAANQAIEMHEARHIESCDDLGAGFRVVLDTVAAHKARYAFLSDRESAAKAAALIGPRQVDDLNTTQLRKKLAHFIEWCHHPLGRAPEAKFAQAMATHLESDFEGELTIDFHHLSDVSEILAKLEGMIANVFEARFAVQPVIVMIAHHRHATA